MKKMLLLMAMAALFCWLSGQALATTCFNSTLNTTGTHDSTFDVLTNYGTVTVTSTDATHATVAFAMSETGTADFDFNTGWHNYSAFLNVNGTFSASASGWTTTTTSQAAAGLGSYNLSAYTYNSNTDGVTFILTATGTTTWADAAAVLAANTVGFDAAAYVYEDNKSGDPCGYIGEHPSGVPIPPSVLLLGSGLLGLVGLGWRREKTQ